MKQTPLLLIPLVLGSLLIISDARTNTVERVVDFKTADGTILKGTYFAAARPGPGVLLFHQSNRTRKSWADIARQLVAAGINALTVDTDPNKTRKQRWPGDLDAAFEFLSSQPGVRRVAEQNTSVAADTAASTRAFPPKSGECKERWAIRPKADAQSGR